MLLMTMGFALIESHDRQTAVLFILVHVYKFFINF